MRSVKQALRQSISKFNPSYQEIFTLTCHIEKIINQRPITISSGNDEVLPITPDNFLVPCNNTSNTSEKNVTHETLNHSLISNKNILNCFWKRWQKEYLLTLNKNPAYKKGTSIHVGDILLLNEGPLKRYRPLVKVLEVYPGRDGKIRSCKIKCRNKILTRSIKLLFPLEFPPREC